MRKDYRQNYRAGTNPFARKSNLQKIAETFGPKKKVKKNKKPTKRMFANKGGGADMGTMGEIKSKLAVAMDKIKRLENLKKPKSDSGMFDPERFDGSEKIKRMEKEKRKEFIKKFKEAGSPEFSKGGSAKKKKKFPDMSGDGKVTMKDVLMARGVIPKKKKTKKKVI